MSAHTPGPWTVSIEGLVGSYRVEESAAHEREAIRADDNERACRITEADARLIAAAPDLLAALEQIARTGYTDIGDRLMVEAAIAKATGAA